MKPETKDAIYSVGYFVVIVFLLYVIVCLIRGVL